MSKDNQILEDFTTSEYKYGFETIIENDSAPKGINEDIVRFISAKKDEPEWMLELRLKAYRHWITLEEPKWPNVHYPKIDFQEIILRYHLFVHQLWLSLSISFSLKPVGRNSF